MKAYSSCVELSKVGEVLVDLYQSADGRLAAAIVDPVSDTVSQVVWLSEGQGEAAMVRCDGQRLVLGTRCSS